MTMLLSPLHTETPTGSCRKCDRYLEDPTSSFCSLECWRAWAPPRRREWDLEVQAEPVVKKRKARSRAQRNTP